MSGGKEQSRRVNVGPQAVALPNIEPLGSPIPGGKAQKSEKVSGHFPTEKNAKRFNNQRRFGTRRGKCRSGRGTGYSLLRMRDHAHI
jgi:hypothetical protein